jgi:hypothetical protein
MHKKPLIAVLIIGLLLLTGNAFAIQGDDDVFFVRVQSPPPDKGTPILVDKGVEPLTGIQGGTPRVVPGTYCTVDATGGFTGYYYGDMVYAGETYVSYNDVDVHSPECAGLSNNYTFDVTATNFITCNDYPGASYWLQPVVYDADLTDPLCPFPGPLSCAGPIYLFTLPTDECYGLNMAFAIECCVTGPYFAGFYCPAQDYNMGMGVDYTGAVPLLQCQTYNDYLGGGWGDVYDWGVVANFLISSEGFTPDDVATHCTAGDCDTQWWYYGDGTGPQNDGWYSGFGMSSTNRDAYWSMFENKAGADTLNSVTIMFWDVIDAGAPTLRVSVYEDIGATSPQCGLPVPDDAGLLGYVDVPYASQSRYPVPTVVDLTSLGPLVFGTLNGGPIERFFIAVSISPLTPDPGVDNTVISYGDPLDPAYPDTGPECMGLYTSPHRSGLHILNPDINPAAPVWAMAGEYDFEGSGHTPGVMDVQAHEWWMDVQMCFEQVPIVEEECGPGDDDEWPTFGHDYQNTSASSINVIDPNGIKLDWVAPLGADMSFCNPTVAGDIVYASSSDRVEAFHLATGAPITGSPFTGIPEMGTSNRGNVTIHDGYAYITGGNFAALTKQVANDLTKNYGVTTMWSNNAITQADMSYQNRFGCAMVIDALGMVLVLTEPISNPHMQGELFAFDIATGDLYGWGTNPVLLNRAARHGPSYDGTYLYVGTADADLTDGSIFCIDPTTGGIVWQFDDNTIDPTYPGGFPGGVSLDGDFLYAVSCDANAAGRRFCIDKSAGTANVVWATAQGSRSLYGPPTVGRNFVYIPFDNSGGIGMVDKAIGLQVHNFVLQGVDMVTQHVTISCDNILFAGDRLARFWCLNANTTDKEWYRQYPVPEIGIVNGTALASHSGGDDYAVVGCRWDGSSGLVAAYKLNTGTRPRLEQYAWDLEILVPLGASGTDHATVAGVFENIGNENLSLGPATVVATTAAASVSRTMPTDERGIEKYRSARMVNGEWHPSVYNRLTESDSRGANRSNVYATAGATVTRTQNIKLNGADDVVLTPGDVSDLQWDYDVSGLGRGVDIEVISVPNDDPDFDLTPVTSVAEFEVTYQGGCALMWDTLAWVDGSKLMTNQGECGEQANADNLVWLTDPIDPHYGIMYDGGFYLLWGDSSALAVRNYLFGERGDFVGNVSPVGGACGFDNWHGTLGYWDNAGIVTPITGTINTVSYSDTNMAGPGTGTVPDDAIGVDIVETQIGSDDAMFGGFVLIQLEYFERNGNVIDEVYGGTFIDWDIPAAYGSNLGAIWTSANGYAIWDEVGPGYGYGFLDPSGTPMHGAVVIDHNGRGINLGPDDLFWNMAVSGAAAHVNDGQGDRAGMLTNAPIAIQANDSAAVYQALFAVDATGGSANEAQMEADAIAIKDLAALWGGWDRGNVNQVGGIDITDVWWLNGHVNPYSYAPFSGVPTQLYPDTYMGDVDADGDVDQDDVDYLFAYIGGGPAPLGAWRF